MAQLGAITPNEIEGEPGIIGGANEEDSEQPWPTGDAEISAHVSSKQKDADGAAGEWYDEAREDFRFYESRQWSDEDTDQLEREDRIPVTFNRCAPIINAIVGQEVNNRQEVKYLPRRVGPVSGADPMDDAVKWAREQCNAEDEDSDAFRDMVISGMGWTVLRMDYESNPEGMIEVLRRDPLLMRWDPAARRKNLADKAWVQSDYWMRKEAIEAKWPDADLAMVMSQTKSSDRMQPIDASQNWKYNRSSTGTHKVGDEFRVVHHVERYQITRHRMIDPATNTMREYSQTQHEQLKDNAETAGVTLPQSLPVQTVLFWEAWVVGGVVLQSGKAGAQKDFPYQCMTCYRERETGYWTGVLKLMRDPQRYANRFMSLMASILATGAKGGALFETGTFANSKKAKDDWGRWNAMIEVNPGKLATIQPREPVNMPPAAAALMQFAIGSIRDVTGVNIELLGQENDNETGVVEDMKSKAGLTILASVFDAMRLYRKRQGALLAEFVQRFISDGRLIRILGQTGQQFIPLIRDQFAMDYDIVVDESPSSRDVKARTWQALGQLAPMLQQQGIFVPSMLDYTPLPQSLVMELKQAVQQKMSQPPQPPIPIQLEQMKQQGAQAQLAQTGQLKQQEIAANSQAQQAEQAAQAQGDAARMQADTAVATHKAELDAHLELIRTHLDAQAAKAEQAQRVQTTLLTAIINAIAKVETARVTVGADSGQQFVTAQGYPQ